ncbi:MULTISPECIES: hypothetical protein [Sphingomonas]|uniref:hypothetical protein n=1 Tax=Sphingomonas TaxID=13687 RepID=UPI00126A696D|nr:MULTISPECIES: hypothetical protein [Sphingomonas]
MTEPVRLPDPATADPFTAMFQQADGWRRDCLALFAELDGIVDKLLAELQPPRRRLKRQKPSDLPPFDRLRELTGSKGALASVGKAISETLADLAPWCEWRRHLDHGVLTVWRGRGHQWLLALAFQQSEAAPTRAYAITWSEACAMRTLVTKRIASLRSNARSLANAVALAA